MERVRKPVRNRNQPDPYCSAYQGHSHHVRTDRWFPHQLTRVGAPLRLPLTPGHISRGELNPFSTFYNLSSLSAKLNLPILELHQLKDLSSVADLTISSDTFACWAVWYFPTIGLFDPWPAEWNPLGLNITLWPTPSDIKSFEDLTRLFKTRPHGHVESLIEQDPKKLNGSRNNPIDTNLLCLSDMFYLRSAALFPTPVEKIDEKVWSEVGQHISFDNTLLARTVETLSRMGIAEAEPYIAIHIRRGDFCWWNRVDCNSNLDSYAVALEAVRSPSCPAFGATTVLVVTDDTSPEFLAAVAAHGWRHVNHANLGTLQTYGEWTITFIDSVIAAQAVGLVGTATSTFSTLAARRATLRHGACIE